MSERDAIEAYVREWRTESCRRGIECEAQGGDTWDEYECHPSTDFGTSIAGDVAEGRRTFDAEAAEACLAALREGRGCVPYAEECWPFEYALDLNASCTPGDDYCRFGLHCDVTQCICVPSPGPGETCANERRCATGSRCVIQTWGEPVCIGQSPPGSGCEHGGDCAEETPYCAEGRCVASFAPGDRCGNPFECGPDLWCEIGDDVSLTCQRPRELGGECFLPGSCVDGLACVDDVCVPLRRAGEDCRYDEDCVAEAPYCVGGFSSGVCRADPDGDLCYAASYQRASQPCGPDHACIRVTPSDSEGRCEPKVGTGDACDSNRQCPLGDRCASGVCAPIAPPGEACGPEAVCPLTHQCRAGLCTPRSVQGDVCSSDADCFLSVCRDGTCGDMPVGSSCGSATALCEGVCDYDTFTCVPLDPLIEGDACPLGRTFCNDGTVCNGDADARCAPLVCR